MYNVNTFFIHLLLIIFNYNYSIVRVSAANTINKTLLPYRLQVKNEEGRHGERTDKEKTVFYFLNRFDGEKRKISIENLV